MRTHDNSHALVAYQERETPGLVTPLVDPADAARAIARYEELKKAIVRPDDTQIISGREFLKKSFWRRVATCFGLSLEMVSEERLILDGKLAYRVMYRASAPNGRWMDGDGMCTQGEKGQMIEHNIRAIAHTRAKNRAISDLVGGGEVSAEEMQDEDSTPRPPKPLARNLPSVRPAVPTQPSSRLVETTSAQETLDDDEAIYYAPEGEPEPEPEHEMTRAEFLTALRDELNLNATQAMEQLKVRSLSGLNLRAALETLRQSLESRPEPEPSYNPKADAKLRQRLNALQIRTLAEVETFIAEAEEQGDGMSLRDACYAYLERQEETARKSAKTSMAAARTPTRGRGPSAIGAMAASDEPTPDSLESLETGARAS